MDRELWIKAMEIFAEDFFEKNGREPTHEEVEAASEGAYANYLSSLEDRIEEMERENKR